MADVYEYQCKLSSKSIHIFNVDVDEAGEVRLRSRTTDDYKKATPFSS